MLVSEDDGKTVPVEETPEEALGIWNKMFLVVLACGWLWLMLTSPVTAVFFPVLLLPTYVLYEYYKKYKEEWGLELNAAISLYAKAFLPGSTVVLLVEMLAAAVISSVLIINPATYAEEASEGYEEGDEDYLIPNVPRDANFFLFLFGMAFLVAATTEEFLKWYIINKIPDVAPNLTNFKGMLFYAVCGALGFSTIENIGYQAAVPGSANLFADDTVWASGVVNCVGRILISSPVHLMCAYLSCIGWIKREYLNERLSTFQILRFSIFFHGFFDFCLMVLEVSNLEDGGSQILLGGAIAAFTIYGLYYVILKEGKDLVLFEEENKSPGGETTTHQGTEYETLL